jgi:hypothetical protein
MKRIVLASIFIPAIAFADPRHVLVLKSEGGDAAYRSRIDAQVLKLAKNIDGNVESGEITLTDAAAATGCAITEASCRDEVLATLGVDEIVATTITPGPVETKITVRRIAKATREQNAQSTIASNQPIDAKLAADVGPIFGVRAPATAPPVTPPPPRPPTPTQPPAPLPTSTGAQVPPPHEAVPPRTAQATTVTGAPDNTIPPAQPTERDGRGNQKLAFAGIVGGGVLVVLGIVMWAEASGVQGDINNARTVNVVDFRHLQDLESSADGYALAGNLMFFGGAALGAVSGYFYWRDHRRAERRTARVAPAVFRHGAGLTLTFGGAR